MSACRKNFFGRATNLDGVLARICVPVFPGGVVEGESARTERNRHLLGFAGSKLHAGKALPTLSADEGLLARLPGHGLAPHRCPPGVERVGHVEGYAVLRI